MARAAVLEEFGSPLVMREFPDPSPDGGRVVVDVLAAGICGSDHHMWRGKDPRTPLPIILGHEGVGRLVAPNGLNDVRGREIRPGRKEMIFHQGKSVENIDEDKACRTKLAVEVKGDIDKLLGEWDRWGWHRVTFYGDLEAPLQDLAKKLNFRLIVEA